MKKQKKLLSILTVFLFLFTVMPFNAKKVFADTAVSNYDELVAAISTAAVGDTINITSDITITSEVTITEGININGNGHTLSVPVPGMDASGKLAVSPSTWRVFNINASGKSITINDMKIKGGRPSEDGAAIVNNDGTTLKLTNVSITNSGGGAGRTPDQAGGGIFNDLNGILYLSACNISRNGAAYGGGFLNRGTMFIENSTFSENRSLDSSGGGGAGENQGSLYVNNSTFANNISTELGSAINNYDGSMFIMNSSFVGNVSSTDLTGCAIRSSSSLNSELVNCVFAYNYWTNDNGNTYTLADFSEDFTWNTNLYNCVYHQNGLPSGVQNINGSSVQYTGAQDGSDNFFSAGGSTTKLVDASGIQMGNGTIYQPFLVKQDPSKPPVVFLKSGSVAYGKAAETAFLSDMSPIFAYKDGSGWQYLAGTTGAESNIVTKDQLGQDRYTSISTSGVNAVGSTIVNSSNLVMLRVLASNGGNVSGGSLYGDVYNAGANVTVAANPDPGCQFVEWKQNINGVISTVTDNPYTLTLNANTDLTPIFKLPLNIDTTDPAVGTVGTAYSGSLSATGGTTPVTFTLSSGILPPGLSLGSDGALTGTPTTKGTFSFTVIAEDSETPTALTSSHQFTMTINPPLLNLAATYPAAGTVGTPYSRSFLATGGTAPITFALTGGTLPPGLSLGSNGTLTGTPTASGTFNFRVTATDSDTPTPQARIRFYVMTINPAVLNIGTTNLVAGRVGTAYSGSFSATGGTASVTYVLTGGTLPTGLSIGSNGTLTGTPTASGTFNFTVTATDSGTPTAQTSSHQFAMTINPAAPSNGGYTPPIIVTPPIDTTTINGKVEDGDTGSEVAQIKAAAATDTNGNKTITMKDSEGLLVKNSDGTTEAFGKTSKVIISNTDGTVVPIAADGTISFNSLPKGSENNYKVYFDIGSGQKLVIGNVKITVSANGDVNVISTLIDPYGTVTDAATGKPIQGVNAALYYANTARNIANGKTPDTLVTLPAIAGYKPNDNANPQISDSLGAYAWMVFPNSDYYIVAAKDGYNKYTSSTISVDQTLVKWDFKMSEIKPTPSIGVIRISGDTRIDTALEIAKAAYSSKISNVILTTADNYPDALTGSVLAYKLDAPILLVGSTDADQQKVLDYLKSNLDPLGTVYILGGTGAVSEKMEAKVTNIGFKNINRLAGADRYDTCARITDMLKIAQGTPIVLVSGENYPDALSISSVAALSQYPILLVKGNEIPANILSEISYIKPSKIYIIGLQGAVSSTAEEQISKTGVIDSANVIRIGGSDRFATSLQIAKYFNLSGSLACIATGNNFPDALAGSLYAAKNNAPIILAAEALSEDQISYINSKKLSGTAIFGGEGAVSKNISNQLTQILGQ